MDGIYVAGIVLCLIGEPITSSTCVFERSYVVFNTKEQCEQLLYDGAETLHLKYDISKVEIVRFECYNWLPETPDQKI